jgi:hypothetical protein
MLTAFEGLASLVTPATLPCANASLVSASVPSSATGGAPGFIDSERVGRDRQDLVLHVDQVERFLGNRDLSAATAATIGLMNTTRSIASTACARRCFFFKHRDVGGP